MTAFIRLKLGNQRVRVFTLEWETKLPELEPLSHKSQERAISQNLPYSKPLIYGNTEATPY